LFKRRKKKTFNPHPQNFTRKTKDRIGTKEDEVEKRRQHKKE
jgi:hypothetical protein